jgi:hypothetical protein
VVSPRSRKMSRPPSRIPVGSTDARRDLQDRLARFALTTFVISGVMLVASIVNEVTSGVWAQGTYQPSRVVHVAVQALLLAAWRVCAGKSLSERAVEILDAALIVVVCTSWALLGFRVPPTEPIEFSIILATTYTLILRSVIVPSTFLRTLVLSFVSMLPTMAFFFQRKLGFIPGAAPEKAQTFVVFSQLWCLVAVLVAALNSRQIYGLRQRIREVGKLGQYTLEEKIGEGGMGVVYRAKHAMLRRPAAIKLLLAGRAEEKDIVRFEREVQLTSLLAHPNTISIFDFGRTADGEFYYVMEYLDGFDLERLIDATGPLDPPRALRILSQVSGALAEAHGLGLIHRDIKPANIILTERIDEPDVVKVVDFGLVRTIAHAPGEVHVTTIDAITGTPMYLAPEALTAPATIDGRADLYALGCVAYYLVTGRPVFEAATVVEVLSKHLSEAPVPPSVRLGRPLEPDFEALILACLSKDREQRPASAAALHAEFSRCADMARVDLDALRRWWREHGDELKRRARPPQMPGDGGTMAIDLRGREARGA